MGDQKELIFGVAFLDLIDEDESTQLLKKLFSEFERKKKKL